MKKNIFILMLISANQSWSAFRTSTNHNLVKQVLAEENKDRAFYAPWRDELNSEEIKNQKTSLSINIKKPCVFCLQIHDRNDKKNLILKRLKHYIIALNPYPYTCGQLLLIPINHTKYLDEQTLQARAELIELVSACIKILKTELTIEGANIGMNFEKSGEKSVSDHHHVHIVPRYSEDISFLELIAETKAISWDLEQLYIKLKTAFESLNLEK